MKITFTTMMLSEDIELPDDENNFYRQLAKKNGFFTAAMQC